MLQRRQNSNFEHVPSKRSSEDPEEDDMKPAAKRIKKEPDDDAQSVTQDEPKVETTAEWSGGESICDSSRKSKSNDESCGIHNG